MRPARHGSQPHATTPAPVAAALLTLAGALVGCAGSGQGRPSSGAPTPTNEPAAAEPAPAAWEAALRRLIATQRTEPDASARLVPPPSGVDLAGLEPLDRSALGPDAKELLPLDTLLARQAANTPTRAEPDPAGDGPTPEAKAEALSLYAAGREAFLAGDTKGASEYLERAARIDPQAPEPQRELAEAYLTLGRRSLANRAFAECVRLGLEDARALQWLGREAARAKRHDEALGFLSRAIAAGMQGPDSVLTNVALADLAESLSAQGYVAASRDALKRALDLPTQIASDSRVRGEAGELLRRRAELWLKVGDASARLGDFEDAQRAYATASLTPGLDSNSALARMVHASLQRGQSAQALFAIRGIVGEHAELTSDREIELVRAMATAGVDRLALAAFRDSLASPHAPSTLGPSSAAKALRLRAAAATPKDARADLTRAFELTPWDAAPVVELLSSFSNDQTDDQARALAALANARPWHADTLADAAILNGRNLPKLLAALSSARDPASDLIAASLAPRLGLATTTPDATPATTDAGRALRVTRAIASADLGDLAPAESILSSFPPDATRGRARLLLALRRDEEAFDVLRTALSRAAADPDLAIIGAQAAVRLAKADVGEQMLEGALASDPRNERVFEALVSLYLPSGPLAGTPKLTEAARRVRETIPLARFVRVSTARDAISRGLWPQALGVLRDIAGPTGGDAETLDALASLAERSASDPATSTNAREHLERLVAARPDSIPAIAALARAMVATGQAQAADALLKSTIERVPAEDLRRQRERALRDKLGNPKLADELALSRLAPTPRSPDRTLEYVELLMRTGRPDEAARALSADLPASARLGPAQRDLLISLINRLPAGDAKDQPTPELAGIGIALIDRARREGIPLPPVLEAKRLRLAIVAFADNPASLFEAARDAETRIPELGRAAYDLVIRTLRQSPKPERCIGFLRVAAKTPPTASTQTVMVWVESIARLGGPIHVREFLDSFTDAELTSILDEYRGNDTADSPDEGKSVRADLAYRIAGGMNALGRQSHSDDTLRLALSFQPDHALAANDLGYNLADRGVELDFAEKLLEVAHAKRPDNVSITDSLGWLRYKQGRLSDFVPAPGEPKKEGALTLLQRAAESADGLENAIVVDHYADALWRAGRRDEAKRAWAQVESQLQMIDPAEPEGQDDLSNAMRLYRQTLRNAKSKLTAAREGKDPPLAPLAEGVTEIK